MKKSILFVKYNKPTDDAFDKIISWLPDDCEIKTLDLRKYGVAMDVLQWHVIRAHLDTMSPLDAVFLGDVFWPTGQGICRWCYNSNIPSIFIQHGQWKYIKNKQHPPYVPTYTCVYGIHVYDMCKTWPYGRRSIVRVIGNPRYDNVELNNEGQGIYFSPPVIMEHSPSVPDKLDEYAQLLVSSMKGIDEHVDLILHPHYREGAINLLKSWFPNAKFIDPEDNPFKWIQRCKKVLTHRDSTVVLDGIAHGKSVVLLNNDRSFFPRGHFGDFAEETKSMEDCLNVLKSPSKENDTTYENKAKKHIFLGNASSRILDILKQCTT